VSPYNEDNTLDSSGYQGYHRSHHRSHTQDSQSEKIEVTIQGHTEESDSSQIEKKTKISLPWKHKGHILIFSLILSIFSIAVPCFTDFANNIQSQNLYIAKMFANGSLPYSDFFATGGFFYYLLVSLAFRLGSTLWLIPIQFLAYYLSGSYLYKTVMHMTSKKEIATLISIIFYVTNGTLGFGGLYPIQFAMPFVLGAIFFLTRYFAGHSRDEAFILYGFAGTAGALFEARTLIFWILSLVTIFVYNLVNKHFARGFYQVLCILFGNILAVQDTDMFITMGVGAAILLLIWIFFKQLLITSFDELLAKAMGMPVNFYHYLLMVLLTLVSVTAMQSVGTILIVAMLITPAATAYLYANSLKSMIFLSSTFGAIASVLGLFIGYSFNVAAGSSIVLTAASFFLISFFIAPKQRYLKLKNKHLLK